MCWEIAIPAIMQAIGIGVSSSSQHQAAKKAASQGAAGLLEQQNYNQQQLDLQNKQLLQTRQQMDMNAWGGANMLSGGETATNLAPTSGTSSIGYGGEGNTDIIPGANQILQQPNVYQWM